MTITGKAFSKSRILGLVLIAGLVIQVLAHYLRGGYLYTDHVTFAFLIGELLSLPGILFATSWCPVTSAPPGVIVFARSATFCNISVIAVINIGFYLLVGLLLMKFRQRSHK